jgi:hypothetical protein
MGGLSIISSRILRIFRDVGFVWAQQKIEMIQPFQDGVGIQRDAQTAPPQLFITGDGWFTYNLF